MENVLYLIRGGKLYFNFFPSKHFACFIPIPLQEVKSATGGTEGGVPDRAPHSEHERGAASDRTRSFAFPSVMGI